MGGPHRGEGEGTEMHETGHAYRNDQTISHEFNGVGAHPDSPHSVANQPFSNAGAHAPAVLHHGHGFHRNMKVFVVFAFLWETMIIVLLAIFATYGESADAIHYDHLKHAAEEGHAAEIEPNMISTSFYAFLQDVHVMIFVGFGFLMTFLKKYGYSAVGLTLLISAMVLQWHMLVGPFWENVLIEEHPWTEKIGIDGRLMLVSDFCAGAAMITFGGILGKCSPIQMCVIAVLETILYSLNETIGIKMGVADIGGTSVIHMFGAYFGMAATRVFSNKKLKGNPNNAAIYSSDLFAMIGTVYLWMFWPSFNGAPAWSATQQHRAVMNTLLSLTGATMAAFAASTLFRHDHRFNMVDVQNATLAGGVVIGGSADLYVGPAWALLIGAGAGFLSVVGYCFITPFLERRLGFLDTCGINNLHGMPSILGAILGAIFASAAKVEEYGSDLGIIYGKRGADGLSRTASYQAGMQLAFIAITLGISIVGGTICAFIAKIPIFAGPGNAYDDSDFWEVPEEEHAPAITAGKDVTVEERLRALEAAIRELRQQS